MQISQKTNDGGSVASVEEANELQVVAYSKPTNITESSFHLQCLLISKALYVKRGQLPDSFSESFQKIPYFINKIGEGHSILWHLTKKKHLFWKRHLYINRTPPPPLSFSAFFLRSNTFWELLFQQELPRCHGLSYCWCFRNPAITSWAW